MNKPLAVLLVICLVLGGCSSEHQAECSAPSKIEPVPLYYFVDGFSLEDAGRSLVLPTPESYADPNREKGDFLLRIVHYDQRCYQNQLNVNGSYTSIDIEVADTHLQYTPLSLRFLQCYKTDDFKNETYVAHIGDELWNLEQLKTCQINADEEILICDFTDHFNASTFGDFDSYLETLQQENPQYDYSYIRDIFILVEQGFSVS